MRKFEWLRALSRSRSALSGAPGGSVGLLQALWSLEGVEA